MSALKHTPGPWVQYDGLIYHDSGLQRHIAKIVYGGVPYTEEQANARLIAALPELLAALSRIIEAADSDAASGGEVFWSDAVYPEVAHARAVLAELTGGKA